MDILFEYILKYTYARNILAYIQFLADIVMIVALCVAAFAEHGLCAFV